MLTKSKKTTLLVFALAFINSLVFSQGYNIKLKAPDFAGQEVILAEYFTTRMVPKDTAQLNLMGEAVFSGNESFDGGLYIIYINSKYYFDLLIDQDQDFTVSADSSDLITLTKFDGSDDNTVFYKYKSYLTEKRIQQNKITEDLAAATNKSDSTQIIKKMEKLNDEMSDYIDETISKNQHSFFATFLLSMQEKTAPEELLKGTQRQKDSIKYVYYKNHYFDNYDFTDIRLLHTPLYERKIKTYINNVVPQHPDSLISAVDFLIDKSKANDAIFRTMLITLFNNFAESKMMGMDKVYFHIAEKYYIPDASWSSEEFIEKLKENLKKSKPTFIGNIAPDFEFKALPKEHFLMAAMDTAIKKDPYVGSVFNLSGIKAEYTVLYFWEADCGHCQKSTPILYDVFKKYQDQDVKVLAVHVINSVEGKEKWVDFVNEHELFDWINCWSPHNNDFRNDYNLLSFPQLFLLDKEKKIIAKNLSPEQVDEILDSLLKKIKYFTTDSMKYKKIQLKLEEGSIFEGYSFGYEGSIAGEVVFNTAMTGYPESLTDPSYRGQILVLTYPLVGNYGVPNESEENNMFRFFESNALHISALIVSDYSKEYSHWNAEKSLGDWLKEHKIPGIFGIDTRLLTKLLREKGSMLGKIIFNNDEPEWYDPNQVNLVEEVSIKEKQIYGSGKNKILLIDCGVKYNIIRYLLERDTTVIRVPFNHDISKEDYDGLFISNGPGDPKQCNATIENLTKAFENELPIFGICLGNQLMALASDADTYKLKYGHRSHNQPVLKVGTDKAYITSQNHGFAIDNNSLSKEWEPLFINLNDQTNEGMRHKTKPFFSTQFHPEASGGPTDTAFLFDEFIDMVEEAKK